MSGKGSNQLFVHRPTVPSLVQSKMKVILQLLRSKWLKNQPWSDAASKGQKLS